MKTTILTLAVVAILSTGSAFAQRNQAKVGPVPVQSRVPARVDNAIDVYKIDQLDRIVNLSFQQEKALNKIENRYDKLINKAQKRPFGQNIQQLEWQKKQEMLAVLTPAQRQKLTAFENRSRFGRRDDFGRHS